MLSDNYIGTAHINQFKVEFHMATEAKPHFNPSGQRTEHRNRKSVCRGLPRPALVRQLLLAGSVEKLYSIILDNVVVQFKLFDRNSRIDI